MITGLPLLAVTVFDRSQIQPLDHLVHKKTEVVGSQHVSHTRRQQPRLFRFVSSKLPHILLSLFFRLFSRGISFSSHTDSEAACTFGTTIQSEQYWVCRHAPNRGVRAGSGARIARPERRNSLRHSRSGRY